MSSVDPILCAADYSEQSKFAFEVACALARQHRAPLIVLHVIPSGTVDLLGLAQMGGQKTTGSIRDTFWRDLRKLQPTDPTIEVEHRLEDGDPVRQILRVAADVHAEMIVMGTEGRSGIGRLLVPSVSYKVMRDATCPVVIVHGGRQHTAQPNECLNVPATGEQAVGKR